MKTVCRLLHSSSVYATRTSVKIDKLAFETALKEKDVTWIAVMKEKESEKHVLNECWRKSWMAVVEEKLQLQSELLERNTKYLKMCNCLSGRGAMEALEYFDPYNEKKSRREVYEYLFVNRFLFRDAIKKYFGEISIREVTNLASQTYGKLSREIHNYDDPDGVILKEEFYGADELKFMKAVCDGVPVKFKVKRDEK